MIGNWQRWELRLSRYSEILALRNGNLLSAEYPGVDRPGARPDQGKACSQHREQDGNPGIGSSRDKRPKLEHSNDSSDDRGPQAEHEQEAGAEGNQLRQYRRISGRHPEVDDRTLHCYAAGNDPLQQQSQAGKAVGESGEEALHDYPVTHYASYGKSER